MCGSSHQRRFPCWASSLPARSLLNRLQPRRPLPPLLLSPAATPAVYFLTRYASIPIRGGIRGLPPGTAVTLVEERPDSLRVKVENLQFDVRKEQVTKDAQVASRLSQTDARAQQQLADSTKATQTRLSQERRTETIKEEDEKERAKNQQDTLRGLEARYRNLQLEEDDLLLRIGQAERSYPIYNRYGRRVYNQPDVTAPQLPFLRGRASDVRRDKEEARKQLQEAQRRYQKQQ